MKPTPADSPFARENCISQELSRGGKATCPLPHLKSPPGHVLLPPRGADAQKHAEPQYLCLQLRRAFPTCSGIRLRPSRRGPLPHQHRGHVTRRPGSRGSQELHRENPHLAWVARAPNPRSDHEPATHAPAAVLSQRWHRSDKRGEKRRPQPIRLGGTSRPTRRPRPISAPRPSPPSGAPPSPMHAVPSRAGKASQRRPGGGARGAWSHPGSRCLPRRARSRSRSLRSPPIAVTASAVGRVRTARPLAVARQLSRAGQAGLLRGFVFAPINFRVPGVPLSLPDAPRRGVPAPNPAIKRSRKDDRPGLPWAGPPIRTRAGVLNPSGTLRSSGGNSAQRRAAACTGDQGLHAAADR